MTVFTSSGTASVSIAAYGDPNFRIFAATTEFIASSIGQPFWGTLQQSIQFDRSIITSSGFNEVTLGWGEITLINADGGYDHLIGNYTNDGQRVLVKVGRYASDPDYANFYTVLDGMASGVHVQEDIVRVFVRDNSYKLDLPAQPNVYDSSYGVLENKRIPRAFGYCRNVTPALIDPTNLVFQVNDGPINAIISIKSRGASLLPEGVNNLDYANEAALIAATVTSGRYVTCIAEGLFRINFTLDGIVTADVQGDKTGGTYVVTTADIVQRLCLSSPYITSASFDAVAFAKCNTDQPAEVNFYLDTESTDTIADCVSKLAKGIGASAGFRRDGLMDISIFIGPPVGGVPSAIYNEIDIENVKRVQLPSGVSPPAYRYRVAFQRNWTVLNQNDVAGSAIVGAAGAGTLQFLTTPYSLASSSTSDQTEIRGKYPSAYDPPPVEAYFTSILSDAPNEAQRLLDLYSKSNYSLYEITLLHRSFIHDINDLVFVSYPKLNLDDGKLLRLVAVSENLETGETVITGFG
jgi:hypothetical protein